MNRILVVAYYILVCGAGLYYATKSHGGNLGTVIAYFNGSRSMPVEALIYSTSLELLFIVFSVSGSALLVLAQYLSKWKLRLIPFIVHLITTMLYVICRIAMVQSVVHLSTSGAIKNIEYWDWSHIFSTLIEIKSVRYISVMLLIGIILLPTALYFETNE